MKDVALMNMWPTEHLTHVDYVRQIKSFDYLNAGFDWLNVEAPLNM
jgi:hypothetical protein